MNGEGDFPLAGQKSAPNAFSLYSGSGDSPNGKQFLVDVNSGYAHKDIARISGAEKSFKTTGFYVIFIEYCCRKDLLSNG